MATQQKFFTVLPDNSIGPTVDYTGISSVYTSKANRAGQMEPIMHANDIDISLSSKDFGNRGVAYITPATSLLKQVVLQLKVTGIFASDWCGYSVLREFGYRLPGCERMIFNGDNMLFKPLGECENMDKRMELLRAAGIRSRVLGDSTRSNLAAQADAASALFAPVLENANERYLYVLLPLPCSSAAADDGTKPFPMHMMQSSLEMDFQFRYQSDVIPNEGMFSTIANVQDYTADYGATATTTRYTYPQILEAQVLYTYASLPTMEMYKDTVYKYPFQALYDNYANLPTKLQADQILDVAKSSKDRVEFSLKGLRNGEITQIAFRFTPDPTKITNRRYNGLKLRNIKLTYAGQTIYRGLNDSETIWGSFYNWLPNYWIAPIDIKLNTASFSAEVNAGTVFSNFTHITGTTDTKYISRHPLGNIYAPPGIGIRAQEGARIVKIPSDKAPLVYGMSHIEYNTASGPQYYYIIPISEKLDHIRKGDYNLGCDFKDSDLKLSFEVVPQGFVGVEDSPTSFCWASAPVKASNSDTALALAADQASLTQIAIDQYILNYQISITSQYQFDGLSAKLIQ